MDDDDEIDPETGLTNKAARNLAKLASTDVSGKRTTPFNEHEQAVFRSAADQILQIVPYCSRIELFGSRARDDFKESSDFDLMVVIPQGIMDYGEEMDALGDRLESVLVPGADVQAIIGVDGEYDDWLDGATTVQIWPG